jgi:hypothetical protein
MRTRVVPKTTNLTPLKRLTYNGVTLKIRFIDNETNDLLDIALTDISNLYLNRDQLSEDSLQHKTLNHTATKSEIHKGSYVPEVTDNTYLNKLTVYLESPEYYKLVNIRNQDLLSLNDTKLTDLHKQDNLREFFFLDVRGKIRGRLGGLKVDLKEVKHNSTNHLIHQVKDKLVITEVIVGDDYEIGLQLTYNGINKYYEIRTPLDPSEFSTIKYQETMLKYTEDLRYALENVNN